MKGRLFFPRESVKMHVLQKPFFKGTGGSCSSFYYGRHLSLSGCLQCFALMSLHFY